MDGAYDKWEYLGMSIQDFLNHEPTLVLTLRAVGRGRCVRCVPSQKRVCIVRLGASMFKGRSMTLIQKKKP